MAITAQLPLSGLIRTASHPVTQKIRTVGFFFESGLHWQFAVRPLLFTVAYVPASKPLDHA
jgi:hypothetical protein